MLQVSRHLVGAYGIVFPVDSHIWPHAMDRIVASTGLSLDSGEASRFIGQCRLVMSEDESVNYFGELGVKPIGLGRSDCCLIAESEMGRCALQVRSLRGIGAGGRELAHAFFTIRSRRDSSLDERNLSLLENVACDVSMSDALPWVVIGSTLRVAYVYHQASQQGSRLYGASLCDVAFDRVLLAEEYDRVDCEGLAALDGCSVEDVACGRIIRYFPSLDDPSEEHTSRVAEVSGRLRFSYD
jgi:hypothetical protein